MSLSRKRKKELRKLQTQANSLWEAQQVLVGEAAAVAREASRQLGNFGREQVVPQVQDKYAEYAAPVRRPRLKVRSSHQRPGRARRRRRRRAPRCRCGMPRTTRARSSPPVTGIDLDAVQEGRRRSSPPAPKGIGAGGVIAIILGVAAALGILYAAWQTLRADDELWVADDPLRAPDA